MAAKSARGRIGARVVPAKRLARAQRREDLLDAAVQLILSGGVERIKLGTECPAIHKRPCVRFPSIRVEETIREILLYSEASFKPL